MFYVQVGQGLKTRNLGPYPDGRVPAGSPYRGAVRGDLEGGDPVLVAVEDSDPLALERVPEVDRVVIVAWDVIVMLLRNYCDNDIGRLPANSNLPDTLKSTALIPNSIASFS